MPAHIPTFWQQDASRIHGDVQSQEPVANLGRRITALLLLSKLLGVVTSYAQNIGEDLLKLPQN